MRLLMHVTRQWLRNPETLEHGAIDIMAPRGTPVLAADE